MLRKNLLIALLFSLSISLFAKDTKLAVLLSAAIPGTGQYYLEKNTKAGVFWTVEVLNWFTFLRLNQEQNIAVDDYEMFAYNKAGIPIGSSEEFYSKAQTWMNDDIFNLEIEKKARNYFQYYTYDPDSYVAYYNSNKTDFDWEWQDEKSIRKFQDLQERKQNLEVFTKFSLAAMFLNRIVSVVDAAITSKKMNKTNYGKLYMSPTVEEPGVKLVYEYKF